MGLPQSAQGRPIAFTRFRSAVRLDPFDLRGLALAMMDPSRKTRKATASGDLSFNLTAYTISHIEL